MPDAVTGPRVAEDEQQAEGALDTAVGLGLAAGAQIEVRDEEWLVRNSRLIRPGEYLIEATGSSPLVRGQEARFLTSLDTPRALLPEETRLEPDLTPEFRCSRLFLEAVMRKTPLPQSERGLAVADSFLLDAMDYQLRPAEKALVNPVRPRLLIGDVVGLGKTLEIGLLLGELIRRGRGERILVVTPPPVLEQFQHELWTRFSIPLVRLDSVGLARIQHRIPAGRNPFTFYRRVIVSMDTLKDRDRYLPLLRQVHWDAVVIDESHNLIGDDRAQGKNPNRRRELAKVLAAQTDALVFASATPHNGKMRSFAGLVNLLDPTAIKNPGKYSADDIKHLYIRRTKTNPEVARSLKDHWAPRGSSLPVHCSATELEEQVFAELAEVWLRRPEQATLDGDEPKISLRGDDRLFPYTLLKSFLSSHRALFETVRKRLGNLKHPLDKPSVTDAAGPEPVVDAVSAEVHSLRRLAWLARRIEHEALPGTGAAPAKLAGLVAVLKEKGVGKGKQVRAVVFSERVETLKWLGEVVPPLLGWTDRDAAAEAVKVLYSGVPEDDQTKYVEEFALGSAKVRLLLTGDGASEGVNLHRECSLLLHWDLPWSLIRIEQRNGRIDRYGQSTPPEFRAMILKTSVPDALDDTAIAERLLERERIVHRDLGTVEAVTQYHDADVEEDRLTRKLLTSPPEEAVQSLEATAPAPQKPEVADDVEQAPLAQSTMGEFGMDFFATDDYIAEAADETAKPETVDGDELPAPRRAVQLRMFDTTREFVRAALEEIDDLKTYKLGVEWDSASDLSFDTPEDLSVRFSALPASYRREQEIDKRVRLTFSPSDAAESLKRARQSTDSLWPDSSYVSDLHPVVDWLVDKVLVQLGRQTAPVLQTSVSEPVFLVQGVWSNVEGRPTVVSWMAVDRLRLPVSEQRVRELTRELLGELGVGPGMDDHRAAGNINALRALVPVAVAKARVHMDELRAVSNAKVDEPLDKFQDKINIWAEETSGSSGSSTRRGTVVAAANELTERVRKLRTSGEPLLRVLAVLEPGA
ncbi:helicase-related protein [Kitasatospora sp. NPDC058032]|uniref:helicase-related protein n=1 Tax=Kitasatospora sp. NPDC058032 TaxID=3346307 RepID=UPI0036D9E5FA